MKPRIYLAGPISGCNHDQRTLWRESLKNGFGEEFDFVDPMDNLIDQADSDYRLVHADIEAIKSSDAVLAYMWKESIGTAFGILHAHDAAKLVVVCDPNHIGSRMVAFYADAVVKTPPAALNAIRLLLKSQGREVMVEKRDGSCERFDRLKLTNSIRKACIDARQSDIGPPRAIVLRTLEKAFTSENVSLIKSQELEEHVWSALAELAADPQYEADFDGIRRAWEGHDSHTYQAVPMPISTVTVHPAPLEVPVRAGGTHSTIWGPPGNIRREAREVFAEIVRVDGITEVRLGPFKNTGAPPAKPHIRLIASKSPNIIDGNCYDKGPKGTLQTFQIRVADANMRDSILKTLRDHLRSTGHMRPGTDAD